MKRLFIVTAPIEYGRYELEWECSLHLNYGTTEVDEMMDANPSLTLWDIEDFVRFCNDQELDLDSVWMKSIEIEVPDDYNPNQSTWYNNLMRF